METPESFFNKKTESNEKIQKYLNKQHKSIAFTSEIQENDSLPFLNAKISRENPEVATRGVLQKMCF